MLTHKNSKVQRPLIRKHVPLYAGYRRAGFPWQVFIWQILVARLYVFKLQKRAARVILDADTRANSVQLFKQLGWIPFFHEAVINRMVLVHKCLYGNCPDYLTQMLLRNADISSRTTRRGTINLVCPRYKRETEGGKSFTVASIRFWNALPDKIKSIKNLANFKNNVSVF